MLFDKRRLARVRLAPDISALGPDAEGVTPAEFRGLITRGSIAVKARLLDQSKIAGVGNLLADETLWQAKVPPAARTSSLQRKDPTGCTGPCGPRWRRPSPTAACTRVP